MAVASTLQQPRFVQELDDQFLALWPHRFDYLYSPHPDPGTKPQWQTETRHPLSDRLINQGTYLYGVRFGSVTQYAMLDIDSGSPYHPRRDPLAISRMCETLEPLGLLQHLILTSSDSGGLHIYFPFETPLTSWKVGIAIATHLENKGFKVMPGWLEVFPNAKAYNPAGNSLYNGHRLPLQQGSYLLNKDLEPIASSGLHFLHNWATATAHNDITSETLERVIAQAQRKIYRVSHKAEKFLNDLNAEIAVGWTGHSQTNRLLGRITMRAYIFGHILGAPEPLTGEALVENVVETAQSLPGFTLWCRHQKDLKTKVKEWVRCIEASHYFPYGSDKLPGNAAPAGPSWNEKQQTEVQKRITKAVIDLQSANNWPGGITERFDRLTTQGISGSSLYKYKHLWHPRFTETAAAVTPINIPPDPPISQGDALGNETPTQSLQAYWETDCKEPDDNGFSAIQTDENSSPGCKTKVPLKRPQLQQLRLEIEQAIASAQKAQAKRQRSYIDDYLDQAQRDYRTQLEQWAASGDPILMTEAKSRLAAMDETNGF
ncbi:hypothetical protein [Leptothoe sp. PORK10 BA2]|uniref:hypothetical protein n=1 Tax=Leptothoe sp. PORK10 BA2 TaxID=3110254 RepID=UPI002B20A724|nr:hypothetical protein [Leptothoe sp. PORK10 BA2]MEA5463618.1 hypothetical protein [Leptothoe sp. PORK10 BA2]